MPDNIVWTPYQRALLEVGRTAPILGVWRVWLGVALVCALAAGYMAASTGLLPAWLAGWCTIGFAYVLLVSWLGFMLVGLQVGLLGLAAAAYPNVKHADDRDLDAKVVRRRSCEIAREYAASPLYSGRWRWVQYADAFADVCLFAALVTANHPVWAVLFGLPVLLQHAAARLGRQELLKLVRQLDTPPELPAKPTPDQVDALLDKLCTPEPGAQG